MLSFVIVPLSIMWTSSDERMILLASILQQWMSTWCDT